MVAAGAGAPFLTARWESLVFLNYACPPRLLEPLVPAGTELDAWQGETLVSLVGFLFTDTRLKGIAIPWHRTFEEVNLRFYVRRTTPAGELRRAVVFIRELVPRAAIATVARWTYNEPYQTVPMSHDIALDATTGGAAAYGWTYAGADYRLGATVRGAAAPLAPGSEAAFITEHYWGYTRQRDGGTVEYRVEHPAWRVWDRAEGHFTGAAGDLYGADFAAVVAHPPRSAFVAVGSEVAVQAGKRIA